MENEAEALDLLSTDLNTLARTKHLPLKVLERKRAALLSQLTYTDVPSEKLFTDTALDDFFTLRTGYITEVAGQSSSGKSNLLLCLACNIQSSVIISTEPFSSTRLHQIAKCADKTIDNVYCVQTPTAEAFMHIIRYQLPVLVREKKVRLVCIDSIGYVFRGSDKPLARRTPELVEVAVRLRKIMHIGVAVVVVNQVSDVFSYNDDLHTMSLDYQMRFLTSGKRAATLGLVWANHVDCRIMLGREYGGGRWIRIVKCPWQPEKEASFVIEQSGIRIESGITK
jgi:hypothetical protein